MRHILVGLSLVLLWSSWAGAQVTGFVEAVGFDNYFRPNSWTPLLINLTSQSAETQDFEIQVVQQDLDKDNVTYTRDITLNGNQQQKFWTYFVPQPTDHGLPSSMDELQKGLKVYLGTRADSSGRSKQLVQLPVKLTLTNLDPPSQGFARDKAKKLVLCISDGSSLPAGLDFNQNTVVGNLTDVAHVSLHPRDLPENVLAYDSVDGIVWLSGDAAQLDESGARRKEALEAYVRRGGHLVVCQNENVHRVDALAELLPIDVRSMKLLDRDRFDPLASLFRSSYSGGDSGKRWKTIAATLHLKTARATPIADAVVEDSIQWSDTTGDQSPWLARRALGLGAVSWVAMDLGQPSLAVAGGPGWQPVWDHVFGWNNATQVRPVPQNVEQRFTVSDGSPPVDLSASLLVGTTQNGKGAGLISIAIAFFIIYWLAAGPGLYFILAARKKTDLSWFVFGVAAIVATGLTVILVKLTLRGPPEVKHSSVARNAIGEHTYVDSRIGLYIPRDGEQQIELADTATDAQSILSPLVVHPDDVKSAEFPAAQDYNIPIRDADAPVSVNIPFRSTLKKIEARWVGDPATGISGNAALVPPTQGSPGKGYLSGTLTNTSGVDLKHVYLIFNYPSAGRAQNWVMHVPYLKKNDQLDLHKTFDGAVSLAVKKEVDFNQQDIKGWIDGQWSSVWFGMVESGSNPTAEELADIPMMAVFDLLPPPEQTESSRAIMLYQRAGRNLNLSAAVRAGRLLVVASADTPLPCPMKVDELKMTGDGRTIFEAVLPLDRSALAAPASKPTTGPTTGPASTPTTAPAPTAGPGRP